MSELTAGRFSRNLAANLAQFFLSLVVGVFYTPFVISRMGVEVYGLIPLANSVTNYLGVLTTAISASVGRYVTMDYARGDIPAANRVFNTFFFVGLVLTSLLAVGGIVAIPYASGWFRLPAGQREAFIRLLTVVLAALLIGMLSSCFDAAIWVRQRFDLRSVIDTVSLAVRTGLVVVLFMFAGARLDWVTLGIIAASLVMFAGNWLVWRRLTPDLRISPAAFDWQRLPEFAGTSRWLLLNQAGVLLAMHVDLVLVNKFVGPEAGGSYAAIQQWSNLLRAVCMQVAIVLAPSFAAQHATDNAGAMVALSKRAVRLLGLVIALPVGLLAGLGKPLLVTWLGAQFGFLSLLAVCVILPVVIEGTHLPLSPVLLAINKVRLPSLVTIGIGLANLGLGIYLARNLGWGMYGVAAATAISTVVRYGILFPVYTALVMGQAWYFYLLEMLRAVVAAVGLTAAGLAVSAWLPAPSWTWLGIAGMVLALAYGASVWLWALDRAERARLKTLALGAFSALR
jgi:membrane protein EpsK